MSDSVRTLERGLIILIEASSNLGSHNNGKKRRALRDVRIGLGLLEDVVHRSRDESIISDLRQYNDLIATANYVNAQRYVQDWYRRVQFTKAEKA